MTDEQIYELAKDKALDIQKYIIDGNVDIDSFAKDCCLAGARSRDAEIEQLKKALSSAQKAMAELAEIARNPWISVEDRLPEEDVEVIGMTKRGWVFLIRRNSNEWCGTEYRELQCPEITHWMPIPKLPKGE